MNDEYITVPAMQGAMDENKEWRVDVSLHDLGKRITLKQIEKLLQYWYELGKIE